MAASLYDLLQQYTAPLNQPAASPMPPASTDLSGVDVVAPVHPRTAPVQMSPIQTSTDQQLMQSTPQATSTVSQTSPPASINYGNTNDVNALKQAVAGEGAPQGAQGGVLRNILGVLSDGFLVSHHDQPVFQQSLQRQQIGQAMAGINYDDPNSVLAAQQRIAMTGAPGSIEAANTVQENAAKQALQRQIQQQNYQYQQERIEASRAGRLNSIVPTIGGVLSGVTTKEAYGPAYDQIARRVASIDPSKTPEDLGLPPRDSWTPGSTSGYGLSANNEVVSSDKAAQRAQSGRDTDVRAGATLGAAGINAKAKVTTAGMNPSQAGYFQSLVEKQKNGGVLTPMEQAYVAHQTQLTHPSRTLIPGNTTGGTAPPGVPTNKAVQWLKANDTPANRGIFAHYFPNYANNIDGILKAN